VNYLQYKLGNFLLHRALLEKSYKLSTGLESRGPRGTFFKIAFFLCERQIKKSSEVFDQESNLALPPPPINSNRS
jgi:hypothetical protein